MISENVGNIEQVQALINELNFDKLCFRRNFNSGTIDPSTEVRQLTSFDCSRSDK